MIRRQLRARKKKQKTPTLNLVSLMDIFTILVFFLMVNSSDVEVLDVSSQIKLPDSKATEHPENRIAISISATAIVVQGREVAQVDSVLADDSPLIEGLADELNYLRARRDVDEGAVTILGDQALPYELLRKVMATCQASSFTRVALAVNRVSEDGGGAT